MKTGTLSPTCDGGGGEEDAEERNYKQLLSMLEVGKIRAVETGDENSETRG